MKMKKMAALLVSFIMICSLFAGLTVTTYAADKASVKLEVYRTTGDGAFGKKIDLTKDKLAEEEEIIVAVQAYGYSKLVPPNGLNTVQLQVEYNAEVFQQAMVMNFEETGYESEMEYYNNESSLGIDLYTELPYVQARTKIDPKKTIVYSTDATDYDQELCWFSLYDNQKRMSCYDAKDITLKYAPATKQGKIIALVVPSSKGYPKERLSGLGSGEDKKMLFAYKLKVRAIPEGGAAQIALNTSNDGFLFSAWDTDESSSITRGYDVLTADIMEAVTPITVNFDLPASANPAATLGAYDEANNKRTVTVNPYTAGTTIKVYADQAKTKKIGEATAATVDIAKNADSTAALNKGEVYVTATETGKGESAAVKVTGTKRTNKTNITSKIANPTGTFTVKVGAALSTAGLPTTIDVPTTYNSSTYAEPGSVKYPVTWALKSGSLAAPGTATAVASLGTAPSGITKQDGDVAAFMPEATVTVAAASYTGATATSPAAKTAQEAFAAGWKTEAELVAWLNANVKVNTTKEGGATAQETTTWTKKSGDFSVKGGTYTYESAAFGTHKATITVTVTPVKGQLGPRAKDATIEVTALDENLNKVERPTTNEALIALMPTKAFVNYGDAASPSQGEADLSWTVKSLSSETGALTDGDIMGTLIRTVTLPADLAWLTVDTNPAPDEVTVKASLELGGVRATAANMPGTDNDMIRVTSKNQQIGIMANLVKKAGAIIEVYDSKEATTPSITHTVTEEEATAQQALFTTDNFRTAGSTRYVGINYGGMKTPNESRLEMAVSAEPAVTLTGTATSVKEGATITETAQLNGTWTFVADSQTWASSADATLTATANTDKSTAAIKGIAAGTATVTFTAKVAHPFAEELLAADPDATNTEVEVTATKAYSVTKKATPPAPSNPTTPGTRPGTSGNHGIGGVVIVPSQKQYFIDIDNITWAKDKINALAEKGIVEGVADKIFAPNNTVTRAEFAKMIVGAFGIYDTNATMNFADTVGAENEWYYKYVASAAKRGIILGYEEDNTFRPTRTISREEMCAIVVRACKATGRTLVRKHQPITFNDDASIMGYAKESVDLMTGAGIIDGMGENMFVPKGSATRAQAAKIIYDVTIG